MPHRHSSIRRLLVALVLLTAIAGIQPGRASAQSGGYTVVDLGSFTPTNPAVATCDYAYLGGAYDINDDGVVTGATAWADRSGTAFRATDGRIKRLKGGKGGAVGNAINADGTVAGFVIDDRGPDPCGATAVEPSFHAAIWEGAELTVLPDDGLSSQALGISDDGLVAGVLVQSFTEVFPVFWSDGQLERLPLPEGAGTGYVIDMDADGRIIGETYNRSAATATRVLWTDGELTLLPATFQAMAIGDDGSVLGLADSGTRPARVVDGELESIPGIADDATGVRFVAANADGDIVGTVDTADGRIPALWQDGELIDITTLLPADAPFTNLMPTGFNDAGMILFASSTAETSDHYAVLVPDTA